MFIKKIQTLIAEGKLEGKLVQAIEFFHKELYTFPVDTKVIIEYTDIVKALTENRFPDEIEYFSNTEYDFIKLLEGDTEEQTEKYDRWLKVFAPLRIEYDEDFLLNVLITAWEGGSNYWIDHADIKHPTRTIDKANEECTSEFAYSAIKDGGSIVFYELEEDYKDKEPPVLTMAKWLKGLEYTVRFFLVHPKAQMFSGCSIFEDGFMLDAGSFDAGVADAVLQYALFDEVMYG